MLLKCRIGCPVLLAKFGLRHVHSIISTPNDRVDIAPRGWGFGDAYACVGQYENQVFRALGPLITVDLARAGAKLTAGLAVVWRDLMEFAAARKKCGGTRISSI